MARVSTVVAQYVLAWVIAICCGAVAAVPYTVSQTNKLSIHGDGRVDVAMTMTFHLEVGAVLSGTHKSILPNATLPILDKGSLAATDSLGQSLRVHHVIQQGWHYVDIDFIRHVYGSVHPQYRVYLKYSMVGAICSTLGSGQRIDLDWAHRWGTIQLKKSRYEIEFVGSKPLMDSICFAASSVRAKCGRHILGATGSEAAYQVGTGALHGAFFTWTAAAANISQQKCAGTNAGGDANNQGSGRQASSTVLIVVLIGSCIALSLSCLFCKLIGTKLFSRWQHRNMNMDLTDLEPGGIFNSDSKSAWATQLGARVEERIEPKKTPRRKEKLECSPATLLAQKTSYRKSESISEVSNVSGGHRKSSHGKSESIGEASNVSAGHVLTSELSTSDTISIEVDFEQGLATPQTECAPDHGLSLHTQPTENTVSIAEVIESTSSSMPSPLSQGHAGSCAPEFENAVPSTPSGLLDHGRIVGSDVPADHGSEAQSFRDAFFEAKESTWCSNAHAALDNDEVPPRSPTDSDAMEFRYAEDGHAYTRQEFIAFFGDQQGQLAWDSAQRVPLA